MNTPKTKTIRLSNSKLILLFLLIDLSLLLIALNVQAKLHYGYWPYIDVLVYLLLSTWTVTYIFFIDHGFFEIQYGIDRLKYLFRKFFVFVLISSITLILFDLDHVSRTMFLGSCIIFLVLKFPISFFYTYLITAREDSPSKNKILVIGASKVGLAIEKFYQLSPTLGYVIGFLDDQLESSEKVKILGKNSDFQRVYDTIPFDEVVITLDIHQENKIKELVNIAEYNGVRPSIVANYYSLFQRNFEIRNLAGIPIVNIREFPLESYIARFWKRVFDLIFSIIALILLAPLFVVTALAIKLDSKGPVFYKPVRLGKRGEQIKIFKFRSMVHTQNTDPTRSTSVNDERITRVGRFMRKYSLDEVPQFINVLLGNMSVVGPRPHRIDLNRRFQEKTRNYLVRHYVKPGITGWAQVNGWRGPTETRHQYIARTLHDLWYIEHWNFALDIYIVLLTIFGKKTRKNAF